MSIFITWLYQPFFNLLIFFYVLIERIPQVEADMGLAVVFLTLVIRVLMLPLSIASTRSRHERHQIEQQIRKAQQNSSSPHIAKEKTRKILGTNRRIVISEAINFMIQMAIFFILYRIFTTGLKGEDLHLVYSFMPDFQFPFNMTFLGRFDLTKPSLMLNIIQSLTILAVEVLTLIDSPYPVSRKDFVRYTLILPVASFFIFIFLPAGKKVFIIVTLWFSFFFILARLLSRWFAKLLDRIDQKAQDQIKSAEQMTQTKSGGSSES